MESSIFDCVRTLKNIDVAQVDAKQLTQNDFKNNYVDKNLPCLIKNAISNWPAVSKWTDSAYLIDQCSDYKVNCYPHMNYIEDENIQNGMELVRFEDAVSKLNETTKEVFSVPSVVIDDSRNFSELKKDIGEFAFLKNPARPLGYPSKRFFLYKGAA
ncbi:MAG: cupin-like domain-containing protein, partial [Gammaproteobacteria bacterium]|nr:cupin-like domain-containing protein [Gammaproteobacteria bacterium]